MFALLTVLIVLAAIVLILVVLVQNSKGGGLSSGFSSSNQIMGVRKTTDVLEKATWGLASVIIVLSLISGKMIQSEKDKANQVDVVAPTGPINSQTAPDVSSDIPLPVEQSAAPAPAPTTPTPAPSK